MSYELFLRLSSQLMPVSDEVFSQRPQMLLTVVAPEEATDAAAEMSSVIEHFPS